MQPSWTAPRDYEERDCTDKEKDPCPKWDVRSPETDLKIWLRRVRLWNAVTIVPPRRRGWKLLNALDQRSMAFKAASMVEDDELTSARGFNWFLKRA